MADAAGPKTVKVTVAQGRVLYHGGRTYVERDEVEMPVEDADLLIERGHLSRLDVHTD